MDWATIVSFSVIAALLVISPGPNGVLIAKTVPISGRQAGFMNIAGFVSAFYLQGALSIFGISIILVQSAQAFLVLKIAGATYLCWIGLKALRDAWRGIAVIPQVDQAKRRRTLKSAYVEGFLTNALNPKTSMFYLAAFPQFIPVGEGAVQWAFLLVFIHSLLNLAWFGAMVFLLARLKRVTQAGLVQRCIKGVTGTIFIGFGVKLATIRP
jgi:threonine/homoserine/homoserine lactone efflux protein